MKDNIAWVVRYGFDYEHDNILGIFTSIYFARKAKKEFRESEKNKQMQYHYVNIEAYEINDWKKK